MRDQDRRKKNAPLQNVKEENREKIRKQGCKMTSRRKEWQTNDTQAGEGKLEDEMDTESALNLGSDKEAVGSSSKISNKE